VKKRVKGIIFEVEKAIENLFGKKCSITGVRKI